MSQNMFGVPAAVYVPLGSGRQYLADPTTGMLTAVNDADVRDLINSGCVGEAVAEAAAATSAVTSVAGRTGAVTLANADISGLGTAAAKADTDDTKAAVASVSGATTVNHLAKFADTAGTLSDGGLALVAGFAKHALIAGGAAGNFTVTGIKTTDTLNMVLRFIGAATTLTGVTDLTGEFTISALNTINNTSGTATTGDKLLVLWTATT